MRSVRASIDSKTTFTAYARNYIVLNETVCIAEPRHHRVDRGSGEQTSPIQDCEKRLCSATLRLRFSSSSRETQLETICKLYESVLVRS